MAALLLGVSGCAVDSDANDVGASEQNLQQGNEGKFTRASFDTICKMGDKDQTIIRMYNSPGIGGGIKVFGSYIYKTINGVRTMVELGRGHEEHDGAQFIADNNWGYGVLQSVTFNGVSRLDGPATNDGFLPEKVSPYFIAPPETTDLRNEFFRNRGTAATAPFPSAQLNRLVAPLAEALVVPSTTRRGQTDVVSTQRTFVFFASAESGYQLGGGFVVDGYVSNSDQLVSNGHIIPRPITKTFPCERVLTPVKPAQNLSGQNICPAGYFNQGGGDCILRKDVPDEFSGTCRGGYTLRNGSCELNIQTSSGCKSDEHSYRGVCYPGR